MKIFWLNLQNTSENDYQKYLTEAESERLLTLKTAEKQKQFLMGRVLLKNKLSQILNCQIKDLRFESNVNGRLELAEPKANLYFNLSHSQDLILLAINTAPIGIDLELKKKRDFLKIAKYFFRESEINLLKNNNSAELFYILWTLKEAFIKCLGGRLFSSAAHLEFILDLERKKINTVLNNDFQFLSFEIFEDYIATIAVQSKEKIPDNSFKLLLSSHSISSTS